MMRLRPAPGEGRLAIRQALVGSLIGLALGVAFSAMKIGYDFMVSEKSEQKDIAQMLAVVREPAAQAGYHLNMQAAAVVVHGALSFAPVREAVLLNDFGETLAAGRNEARLGDDAAWWTRFIAPTQEHRLLLTYGPTPRKVGELLVVTTRGPRVERFLQDVWRDVALSMLGSLVVAAALGLWFNATLTRPLMSIVGRIRRGMADSEKDSMPEAARADEIGQIAQAFERYEREAHERARNIQTAAAALSASELRHRRIVETAGEGVWQVDQQGATTLANEAMARMLGTTVEALHGRSIFDFMDEDGRRLAEWLLGRHSSGNERRELRFVRADGTELWAEVSACSITEADGRQTGALAMVTNATERRRRDDELRATNARLLAMVGDLERHKQDMAHIAELNELLQSAGTEAEAFNVIGTVGSRLFSGGCGGLSITGVDDEMVRAGVWGESSCLPSRYERVDCWAIRRGGQHLQAPGHGVTCIHHPGAKFGKLLCAPLYVEGNLLGVLHVADCDVPSNDLVDDAVRRRVEIFGEVIKLGLSNLRLRDTLREQAMRDVLTGLPNRRFFDETLPRELARSLRSGQALTVAIVDVDRFKHFNDHYGHYIGDRVLRSVGTTLARGIRSGDLACRYGGDEFMCLLIGTTAEEARDRFVRLLAEARVGEELGPQAMPEPVTFTIGLASTDGSGTDAATLLRAADEALYAAKARGGHCVEVARAGSGQAQAEPSVAGAGAASLPLQH